jgi:hypothetical protein
MSKESEGMHPLIALLANSDQRDSALYALCKNRDMFPELTSVLINPCPFTVNPVPHGDV